MRLVMVEWVDSFGCSTDWEELSDDRHPKPVVCRSVGWLFRDEPACKVIVPHVAELGAKTKQGCGDMTIPTECVLRIVDLTESPVVPQGGESTLRERAERALHPPSR